MIVALVLAAVLSIERITYAAVWRHPDVFLSPVATGSPVTRSPET